jgi:hypothetical protein
LGYTPDVFLTDDFDKRAYKISEHVRNVTDCLEAYLDTDEDDQEHSAIMSLELPLSIIATLGLKASDYAIRAQSSKTVRDPVTGDSHREPGYIRIWNRATVAKDQMTPELYFYVSPHERDYAIILYFNRNGSDGVLQNLRDEYKNLLKKDEEDKEWFSGFSNDNTEWLPKQVREGELSSYCSTTEVLPDQSLMSQILTQLFKEYIEVVWQAKGIDLMPDYFREAGESELSPAECYNLLTGNTGFNSSVVQKVLHANSFRCEIDPSHQTFPTDSGEQYMEVVPLIPLRSAAPYGRAAMSEANAVCLCPTCRAKLQFGKHEDREDMLMLLFRKHKEILKKADINIMTGDLLKMHEL